MAGQEPRAANRLYLSESLVAANSGLAPPPHARSSLLSSKVYASVIVDIQASELKDRLFTYEVPEDLISDAFIGAHVLVPFGANQAVGGMILALNEHYDEQLKSIKKISEVVESEPLFDRDYVEFLYWISDYYCARMADVISAAIPANFSPRLKRIVSLVNPAQAESLTQGSSDLFVRTILSQLLAAKKHTLAISTVKQKCKRLRGYTGAHFLKILNHLRVDGVIKTAEEKAAGTTVKTVKTVAWTGQEAVNAKQAEIVAVLKREGGQMAVKNLVEVAKTTAETVKKMSANGLLSIFEVEDIRDPLAHLTNGQTTLKMPPTLTDEQEQAFNVLANAMDEALARKIRATSTDEVSGNGKSSNGHAESGESVSAEEHEPWLLHGVTGSGKTEIYLRLIDKALKLNRTAILLVPEISLTPQSARRLTERFGTNVAVWHSGLSAGERYDTWRKLRLGQVKVLLGARSAILASMPSVGLIILDEEHDSSYKQTSPSPRYSAKELAVERARRAGALVVFGSATPDIVVYKAAKSSRRYVQLANRVYKQAMPKVHIVDMRSEFQNGNRSIFSNLLLDRLTATLKKKEQAILLMNRRGFASHVFCRACGHVARCKNCSVSLVFHQSPQRANNAKTSAKEDYARGHLACHHCGFRRGSIFECPACKSPFIRQQGQGTQRVQLEVQELFPEAKVLRLDSDIATRKGAHDEILEQFAQGQADILIGTQMVAKGLDIANVTLVGVVAADAAFNMPDYRSTERGFQLLTQVSGRTGRGDKAGEVVWQTYNTEMPVLSWARNHDFSEFAEQELKARESFHYPPFSQLIRVVVAGPVAGDVERACDLLAEALGTFLADEFPLAAMQILGPAPCLLERLRGQYRYHLLIKNFAGHAGQQVVSRFLREQRMPEGIVMAVDVDALDLL
jgi:primosomal protein N' (replication factor Y)